jgi:hypothetical protein
MVSWLSAWAEDRATLGSDPSAAPGAKTEERAADRSMFSARASNPLRFWHFAINPSRRSREPFDGEQHSMPGDGLPDRCKSESLVLQFRLNQDKSTACVLGGGVSASSAWTTTDTHEKRIARSQVQHSKFSVR